MQAVAQTMWAVQTGQSWQQAVADTPDALRPGVQALGFTALRNWGRAQALCAELAAKPPPKPVVRSTPSTRLPKADSAAPIMPAQAAMTCTQ